jgi:orotidine-5'-phosphate decarboxylase
LKNHVESAQIEFEGEIRVSFNRLEKRIAEMKNPTAAGLDPSFDNLPVFIKQRAVSSFGINLEAAARAVLEFNCGLIDALCDIVPAVKPQCAYYELLGWQGMRTLYETIGYAKAKGMFVITDGKRGDIGTTMEAYAAAHLGEVEIGGVKASPFAADALTVNGYLGTDCIAPLLKVCEKYDSGIFVLVKTSNPSSGELQDKLVDGEPVYGLMGGMCERWNGSVPEGSYGPVGAVVGATYPQQLKDLRQKMPHTFFLVPGYGAQGGKASDVAYAFDKKGGGAVVNSSRAIMYAYKKEGCSEREYAQAARREALRMRDEMNGFL